MAPKKKKEVRARRKSHKVLTPLHSPTTITSLFPSPHDPSSPPRPPDMPVMLSSPSTSSTTLVSSRPSSVDFSHHSRILSSVVRRPFPLSSHASAGPSSSTGETHQEPRSCGESGEISLPPPPPPSDDNPHDPAKLSKDPRPSESPVRSHGVAEAAELLTTHRQECAEPSAKQRASRKNAAKPPTGKQSAHRRRPSLNEDLAQLLVPAAASKVFALARYDRTEDAKMLPDRLLESVGLALPNLNEVVESLQELAEKKGDEAEIDAAAKASEGMRSIATMYGAASVLLAEKVKREARRSSGSCKEEGSGSSAAGRGPDKDDDGGEGKGLGV